MPLCHRITLDTIRLTGADRLPWLHNFCTAEIRSRQPGDHCEAFILDAKGRVLAWLLVLVHESDVELLLPAGQAPGIVEHLDRYLIREDVRLAIPTAAFESWLLFGPDASEWVHGASGCALPPGRFIDAVVNGQTVMLAASSYFGDAILMRFPTDSGHAAWESGLGLTWVNASEFERHRIRHRLPSWGIDCDETYLPQEFQRDSWAISFTKGCYLGQETVARIDALGHVNRVLAVLHVQGIPSEPLPVDICDEHGQVVGRVTSLTHDSDMQRAEAIATIKRTVANPGTSLRIGDKPALVVEGLTQAR